MIPIVIALVVTAVAGGGFALTKILSRAAGKRLAIVGHTSAGKTTLFKFLSTGTIPEKHFETKKPEHFDGDVKLADLKLKIELTDMPGSKDAWATWRTECEQADRACFLVAHDKLVNRYSEVERQARQVGSWNLKTPVSLIVTFRDLVPDLSDTEIKEGEEARGIKRALNASSVHVVDLTDEGSRHGFGVDLLTELAGGAAK
ncbi:Rab family GTPase [Demequina rhizosphaerae]|uniref:Rab family GTPase n=1 Tax=Demequina rhizosphaerae TaxID=1638985 RepID=UPI0007858F16|nr:GTPase domain-containing protein [Demequina rhizosphaerae]